MSINEALAHLCSGGSCTDLDQNVVEELWHIGCVTHDGKLTEQGRWCHRGNVRSAEQRQHILSHMRAHGMGVPDA